MIKNTSEVNGWTYSRNKITKEFRFSGFSQAVEFVAGLSNYFDKIEQHPEVQIKYRKVKFELSKNNTGRIVSEIDSRYEENLKIKLQPPATLFRITI